jgi:co-chaperonin GroES (HSP10)
MTAPIYPLSDQILVEPLPFEDKIKGIWIPETVDHGRLPIRLGIVRALGCGDMVAPKCEDCGGEFSVNSCDACGGSGFLPHKRTEFTVKEGDKVAFHPRPWAEININGKMYVISHEDQHVLCVIEDDDPQ